MVAHQNEELVRKAYDALSRGDLHEAVTSFAEDVVVHRPGRSPIAGEYKGRDEVLDLFLEEVKRSGASRSIAVHDAFASDDHAVVLVRSRAQRNDRSMEFADVHVWHVRKDELSELWEHPGDQHAADEFWS